MSRLKTESYAALDLTLGTPAVPQRQPPNTAANGKTPD